MLREALASVDEVRNESVIEVIVVDDGSSEAKTQRILKEAAEGGLLRRRSAEPRTGRCQERWDPLGQTRIHFALG